MDTSAATDIQASAAVQSTKAPLSLKELTLRGRRVRLSDLESIPTDQLWKGVPASERQGIIDSEFLLQDFASDLKSLDTPGMLESSPEALEELPGYYAEMASMVAILEARKSAAGMAVLAEITELRCALNVS